MKSLPHALVLLGLAAAQAQGQTARNFEVVRVAEGVYTFVQREPLASPIDGNTTVIINDEDVVVVDTKVTPATAREVIAAIRSLTSKPVSVVVNTHWHGDHHYGNDEFRRAFPAAIFVAHQRSLDDLLLKDTDSARLAEVARVPGVIDARRRMLATNKLADGSAMSEEMRRFYERQIPALEFRLSELQRTRISPPTTTITDRLTLRRGARIIDIRFLGRANTRGDLVVHLPREGVVITGDVLVAPIPFSFGSFLGDWVKTLSRVRALSAAVVVPGHGMPQRDYAYLDTFVSLLESTLSQTRAAVAAGKDLEATRAAVDLSQFKRRFAGESQLLSRSFDNFFVTPAIERAFMEARGELPSDTVSASASLLSAPGSDPAVRANLKGAPSEAPERRRRPEGS